VRWGYFTTDGQYVLVSSTLVGLATRYYFLSECCGLVSVARPLWREDGSAICSVIAQWFESRRTRNHALLSHLRLPQPGGPGSCLYIPPGTGWPSYTRRHWVTVRKMEVRVRWNSRSYFTVSHSRLPQPGGSGPRIYIPQGSGWHSYTPKALSFLFLTS
jgi:hypothetical protein